MIYIKTKEEIDRMREGGKILAKILKEARREVKPGITTKELDILAEKKILQAGGKPSFKGYQDAKGNIFPTALCTSVNEELVHGIPSSKRILKEGDIIGLDLGMVYKGMYTDAACTVGVGKISLKAQKLIDVAEGALEVAIKTIKPEITLGDLGYAIQSFVEKEGFSVVRQLVGHGVGKAVHEDPQIPNFGKPGKGLELKEGMTLAIEPMVSAGDWKVNFSKNGWTAVMADGSLSSHFEHTVAITQSGVKVLTRE